MPPIEFPWTYPYRYDSGGSPAPLLTIGLRIGDYEADFLALVDTGAERTLLEGVHARAAGIDIFAGEALTFQGFLGARTVAYLHRVKLIIQGAEIETAVAFSTQPLARQVVGRDILAHFVLGVRERVWEFYLDREKL